MKDTHKEVYGTAELAKSYEARHERNPLERYLAEHLRPVLLRSVRDAATGATRVCDLGTGTGFYLSEIESSVPEVVAVDTSDEMLAIARDRLTSARLFRADATDTGLPEGVFDCVLSFGVLEYVSPNELIREAYRLLRPGGGFLLQTPNRWGGEKAVNLFIKHTIKRRPRIQTYYSKSECIDFLRQGGFAVERIVMNDGAVWLPPLLMRSIGPTIYRAVESFWRMFGSNPFAQNMVFRCRKQE